MDHLGKISAMADDLAAISDSIKGERLSGWWRDVLFSAIKDLAGAVVLVDDAVREAPEGMDDDDGGGSDTKLPDAELLALMLKLTGRQ
jgi:hypothetical protein